MLLCIDIGNTNIVLGLYRGEELAAHWRIATDHQRLADEYAILLIELFRLEGYGVDDVDGIAIASVVPPLTGTFVSLSKDYFGCTPLVLDAGVRTGVRIRYDNPRDVGADRVANAVAAHLQAADALHRDSGCSGRTYFITNGEPVVMRHLINKILAALKLPPVVKTLSPRTAYLLGAVTEAVYTLFGSSSEPPMTRFIARQLSCAHWYNISAAKRDLGYEPLISIDDGLKRLKIP